jgi:rhodanese-related sulfurtransferase
MSVSEISPVDLHEILKTDQEIAFLDVREHGIHAQGHPLYAVPMSLSHLELNIERTVPRKDVQVVLLDQNDFGDLAGRGAEVLAGMGYTNISILRDGVEGWHGAGLEVFSGVNVPSKAFGEFVEHGCNTPRITAKDLDKRIRAGEDMVILDSRPYAEYNRMAIPGGIDAPGAELVYRAHEMVTDDTTSIVVNCAGRTRSIIGAQSLINGGVKNPVMALKDGTMGWYLAGLTTKTGLTDVAPVPGKAAFEKALQGAEKLAADIGVTEIDKISLDVMMARTDTESIFVLDVRTAEEFEAGHISGSQHAPGGQLVQATDEYVGVRNAKLILIDDKRVRALMTAGWLLQLGWQSVSVLSDLSDFHLQTGPQNNPDVARYEGISAFELDAVLSSGQPVALLDLSPSLSFRKSHIPGAHWIIRSRLARDMIFLPPIGMVILTAEDERIAHLAVREVLAARPEVIVRVLVDGNDGWRKLGLAMDSGDQPMLSSLEDAWYKPYDNKDKVKERMQEYLDWEVALVPQVERDGTARFKIHKS